MYLIYKYTSPSNKVYIGQTCKTLSARAEPGGTGYRPCVAFWRAIQKYGWDNIRGEILEAVDTLEEANEKEQYYIQLFQSNNPEYGYNIYGGGNNHIDFELQQRLADIKKMWDEGKTVGEIQEKYHLKQQTLSYEMLKAGIDGRERISRSAGKYLAKTTYQYDKDYNLVNKFESAGQAEKQTGITNITRTCKKNEEVDIPKYRAGKYYWTYHEYNPGEI